MTGEQFAALVAKLEEQAQRRPAAYQLKVLLLATLGNVYLGAIVLLIVALLIASIASILILKAFAIKIVVFIGAFLWLVLKAVWIKVAPPQGMEINAKHAPRLFAMIDDLRHALGAPRFHHVLVTDDFNAGVVQSPRLGIFGWYRNYLMIGLPLLKALTVEQFKAVLAHEFGHLAKGHGRMSNWIYHQRLRWSRLMNALEATESRGLLLFKPFLNWFAPYFNAYSFPLARANEYEADATAARLSSPSAAAAALTNVNVVGDYLAERYWPQIHMKADDLPQPGFTPFSSMSHQVATELDPVSGKSWLERAMTAETTIADTHPALSDRLKAIGESPHLAPPAPTEAADQLLGESLNPITERLDQRWKEHILPAWQQRHQEVQEARSRLAELNVRLEGGGELTLQEAYDRAGLTESVGNDPEGAFAQFQALHERAPDDPVIAMSLGTRLLARGDETGCAMVERAMTINEDLTLRACEALRDYYWQKDRKEEAHAWHNRLLEREELEKAAEKERNQILLADKFEPHDLPKDALEQLAAQLRTVDGLRKAYFIKKQVRHLTHRPCYVLGFTATGPFQMHGEKRTVKVLQGIQRSVQFPGETLIINVEGDNYRFGRRFRRMKGARIL